MGGENREMGIGRILTQTKIVWRLAVVQHRQCERDQSRHFTF